MAKKDVRTRLVVAAQPFPAGHGDTPEVLWLTLTNQHRHFDNNSEVQDLQIRVTCEQWSFINWLLNAVDQSLGLMKIDPNGTEMMDDDTMVLAYILEHKGS